MAKRYSWDPVKKVLDVIQSFSSKQPEPPPKTPQSGPPPLKQDPTQKLFPPKPQTGDQTQSLLGKSSENVQVRDKYSYDPASKTLEHQRAYGTSPKEAVPHVPEKDIATQKLQRGKPAGGEKTRILPREKPLPPRGSPHVSGGRAISPDSPEGLERITQRIPQEVAEEARAAARQMSKPSLWSKIKPRLRGIGIASLAGIAVGIIGFAIFEYAADEAQRKMGADADVSALLPSANKVVWISAPFTRTSRENAPPYYEPNVVAEDVTITSSEDGILALGISLQGLPEVFANSNNINGLGEGNSDWLCQPAGGYLVCWSTSRGYPLAKGVESIVSMQFHLPADELNKMLSQREGFRQVYLIAP